jgi:(4-(4-[2-(gamma-L-glutamylamino)ethyl]phenoxymethyl)furan-2-yl)methanamine synthase
VRDTLLIDVGSTTSDIIPIVSGAVAAEGRTDPDRLRSGELVYTGALRTPVSAIVHAVPLGGGRCRVAAEHFAVAADVHLWLGHIEEDGYTVETPDGRGRTRADAAARIARMVCADLEMVGPNEVTAIAGHVARTQIRQIAGGIRQVVRRLGEAAAPRTAVLAGQGVFLARAAAEACGLVVRDLTTELGVAGARAAPAAAVGYLLAETLEER